MGISISASRALMGVGLILGGLVSIGNATTIDPNNFGQNFKEENGIWKNTDKSANFSLSDDGIFDNKKIEITTDGKVELPQFYQENGSLTITAKGGVESQRINGDAYLDVYSPLTINGNFTMDKSSIAGNLNVSKIPMVVNGEVKVTGSLFGVVFNDTNNIPLEVSFITGATKFNDGITTSNRVLGAYGKGVFEFIDNTLRLSNNSNVLTKNTLIKKEFEDEYIIDRFDDLQKFEKDGTLPDIEKYKQDYLVLYTLKVKGDELLATGTLQVNEKSLLAAQLGMADDLLNDIKEAKEDIENNNYGAEDYIKAKEEALKLLDALGEEIKAKIVELKEKYDKASTTSIGTLTANNASTQTIANALVKIKTNNEQVKALLASIALDVKKLDNLLSSIETSAKSVLNSTNANSSANTAMNISNDISITARNTHYDNPYLFAEMLRDSKIASVDSDVALDYYGVNHYTNSVWANAFGGTNIIDGENGGLFGVSFGYDRKINDQVLLGVYGTYANSELKDKSAKTEADNFQLGIYSNVKFAKNWEANVKAYGQISSTDLTTSQGIAGVNTADYTQRFFGLSGNVGYVFNPSYGFYIKPFGGLNYYYGYTPSYTEIGILPKDVDSATNNSVSLEAGAEFRKYFNASAYIFATPKIEQYIINGGDDYTASFVGATQGFTIQNNDKKKTYGQLLVGGNIALNDTLSINAGIGIKQILAGKVDSKDETYLSGNIGLKYRF